MMLNLLQRGFQPGANPPPNLENNAGFLAGFVIGYVCGIGLLLILSYGPYVLILLRQMQALNEVRERNRAIEPGMVWFGLIPLFGSFWMIYVTNKTAASLADEFHDRRLRPRGDNAKAVGLTYAILVAVSCGLFLASFVPFIGAVFGCGYFVVMIAQVVFGFVYASKLNAVTQRLRQNSEKGGGDDPDGEDDEEPKPRSRPKPKRPPEDDDEFEEYDEPKGGR